METTNGKIMAKKSEKNIITGLDIGTSKVVALLGEVTPSGTIEIIGIGRHSSRGLKRGVVVDIEATVNSIQRAVQEAELMAGCEVRNVYTGIAGSHIRSLNSHGIVAIRDQEVSPADIERVIDAAKAVVIPADQKILHILPQEFIIDNQGNIREPVGMAGVRLEARVHIVTGAVSAAQNIAKCVRRCGLDVNDIILEQLASSHAVLTDDEKELGVCLIDIGGGTTDVAIFLGGAIQHTAVIPIAGDQVTNDIAVALRTPTKAAEVIKLNHGCVMSELANASQMIEVLSVNERPGRKISAKALSDVVSARYEELFMLVRNELRRSGFEELIAAGIVLTGGASNVHGAIELAEMCFEMPVRHGCAQPIAGLGEASTNPSLATGVGLLLHGFQQQYEGGYNVPVLNDTSSSIWTRMKQWFHGNF
ncbi:cell division protein FtsA [Legionella septentrionalis]|uniref:Cell division protein FtsA n=2 Tax=Legionella septentrionalis TaxID=2498109 RepID=A0A3S0VBM7_9GAMM|nr:cell division protein FtsA [Legionella septentrionalis]